MKRIAALILIIGTATAGGITAAFAEDNREPEHHNLSVHIFYPLSTTKHPQDSSLINYSMFYGRMGEVSGIDVGHGFSLITGDMKGVQALGLASYVGGEMQGVNGTGVASVVAGDMWGVQSSGVANWTGGTLNGLQAAGVVNVARQVNGVQASGVLNLAGEVNGMQIGLVNLSDRMNGMPLGLINLSKNGGVQLSGWYSSLTEANTGLRFRAGNFYTLFGVGLDASDYGSISEIEETTGSISNSFSFGASLPVGPLALNADVGMVSIDEEDFYELNEEKDRLGMQCRGMLEFSLFGGLSIFGGAGAAYMVDATEDPTEKDIRNGEWEHFYFLGAGIEFGDRSGHER
jgi:hypothetical protein